MTARQPFRVQCCLIKDRSLLQIQHAGEGGLYAELIQDRSFSGLAYTQVSLSYGSHAAPPAAKSQLHDLQSQH